MPEWSVLDSWSSPLEMRVKARPAWPRLVPPATADAHDTRMDKESECPFLAGYGHLTRRGCLKRGRQVCWHSRNCFANGKSCRLVTHNVVRYNPYDCRVSRR